MLGYDKAILHTNYWRYSYKKKCSGEVHCISQWAMIFDRNTAA